VYGGYENLARALLQHGKSYDSRNHRSFATSPLLLLTHLCGRMSGANPNIADQKGCFPLHYVCTVAAAGYADILEDILNHGDNCAVEYADHKVSA